MFLEIFKEKYAWGKKSTVKVVPSSDPTNDKNKGSNL